MPSEACTNPDPFTLHTKQLQKPCIQLKHCSTISRMYRPKNVCNSNAVLQSLEQNNVCDSNATPLTLQFALVFDMQLLGDQGVPQPLGAVEHLGALGVGEGDGAHVGGLQGVEAGNPPHLVARALSSGEVNGVLGDVEACHDSSSTGVDQGMNHLWLNLKHACCQS